ERVNDKGEGMFFTDIKEVSRAFYAKQVGLQAKVKVRIDEVEIGEDGEKRKTRTVYDTTVGRALLWNIVPDGMPFDMVNQPMKKKAISRVLNECYRKVGLKATVIFADQLMYTGFD